MLQRQLRGLDAAAVCLRAAGYRRTAISIHPSKIFDAVSRGYWNYVRDACLHVSRRFVARARYGSRLDGFGARLVGDVRVVLVCRTARAHENGHGYRDLCVAAFRTDEAPSHGTWPLHASG